MRPGRAHLAAALTLALAAPALAEPNAASLLFETPALTALPTGTTLIYRLERTGGDPGALPASTVELSLRPDAEGGGRNAHIVIVAGDRRQPAGPFPSLVGNPVLLVFLERDIAEMSRTLRGSPYYIRNRIREALGAATPAEPARFVFEGREVEGWRAAVSPFAQDRNRDRLREHADKRYEFTLSDAVPGGLYEVRTSRPGADGAPPAGERLAFERALPPAGDAR
jgi:hypothetical protein